MINDCFDHRLMVSSVYRIKSNFPTIPRTDLLETSGLAVLTAWILILSILQPYYRSFSRSSQPYRFRIETVCFCVSVCPGWAVGRSWHYDEPRPWCWDRSRCDDQVAVQYPLWYLYTIPVYPIIDRNEGVSGPTASSGCQTLYFSSKMCFFGQFQTGSYSWRSLERVWI